MLALELIKAELELRRFSILVSNSPAHWLGAVRRSLIT